MEDCEEAARKFFQFIRHCSREKSGAIFHRKDMDTDAGCSLSPQGRIEEICLQFFIKNFNE